MRRNIILLICYLVQYCINAGVIVNEEYLIKEDNIPSYFYRKYDQVQEDVFPRDIRIKVSLSKITGTLLYSIDKHMNQLIVTLSDGITSTMIIEYNKQPFYISLNKLCGCSNCQYKILDFVLLVDKEIDIKCNEGSVEKFTPSKQLQLNEAYPILYSKNDYSKQSTNEAHLWLVNFPQYNNVAPNNVQLSGCVFEVLYNDKPIVFTKISDNIERRCVKTCDKNICNDGQCYETYNLVPVCDCTHTFLNGPFCNDKIGPINMQSIGQKQNFLFHMVKLSWRSSFPEILVLKNKLVQIRLIRIGSVLNFEYTGSSTTTKETLSKSYIENKEYIFVANFTENKVSLEFSNGNWTKSVIWIPRILRKEQFTSLIIRSGKGDIELVHRTPTMGYRWEKVFVSQSEEFQNDESERTTTNVGQGQNIGATEFSKNTNYAWIVAIICIAVVLIVAIICAILYIQFGVRRLPNRLKLKKEKDNNSDGSEQILLQIQPKAQSEPSRVVHFNKETDGMDVKHRPSKTKDKKKEKKRRNYEYDSDINISSINDFKKEENVLCKGQFGQIFKYIHKLTDKVYSVEEVRVSSINKDFIERMDNVIKGFTNLRPHSRILRYFNIINVDNVIRIFTEFMELDSIKDCLDNYGPMDVNKSTLFGRQILEGLEFLHDNNIIHGDVRGQNVLIYDGENVKLKNFGMSKCIQAISACHNINKGNVNTYWMAPELISGGSHSTYTDVWSMGATMIEMLTATHPYPGEKPLAAMNKITRNGTLQYELPDPISNILQSFIDKMLAPIPSERPKVHILLTDDVFNNLED